MVRAILYSFLFVCLVGSRFAALAVATAAEQNEQFDRIIELITSHINSSGLNEVTIPDLVYSGGLVTLRGGKLKDLGSLKRVGDASVSGELTSTHVNGSVAFSSLEIDINEFNVQLFLLPIGGGSATVKFGDNQIDLDVVVNMDSSAGKCGVTVNNMALSKLGDIQLSFEKFSVVNWLIERIAFFTLNSFAGALVSAFGTSLTAVAQSVFSGLNLCSST